MEYGHDGNLIALEEAKRAIKADKTCAEWSFLKGKSMGTYDSLDLFKKSNAAYTILLVSQKHISITWVGRLIACSSVARVVEVVKAMNLFSVLTEPKPLHGRLWFVKAPRIEFSPICGRVSGRGPTSTTVDDSGGSSILLWVYATKQVCYQSVLNSTLWVTFFFLNVLGLLYLIYVLWSVCNVSLKYYVMISYCII